MEMWRCGGHEEYPVYSISGRYGDVGAMKNIQYIVSQGDMEMWGHEEYPVYSISWRYGDVGAMKNIQYIVSQGDMEMWGP